MWNVHYASFRSIQAIHVRPLFRPIGIHWSPTKPWLSSTPPLDSLRPAMKFKEFSGGKHGESRGGIDLGWQLIAIPKKDVGNKVFLFKEGNARGEMVDVASNQSYGSGYILYRKLMKSSALFLFLNVSSLAGFVSEDVGTNLGL